MKEATIRQQEIVNCARKIITTQGIENLTIREIADDLDVTDGALYRHFKSKREIISLLIDDIEETLFNAIEFATQKADDPDNKINEYFLIAYFLC